MKRQLFDLSPNTLDRFCELMGGAFYIFNVHILRKNYRIFKSSLEKYYSNSQVAYSVKANYMPQILRELSKLNGVAEVVSRFEYDVCRKFLKGKDVIFNGPVKSKEDVRIALCEGATVNVDSWAQIKIIEEISSEFDLIEVGIRYNSSQLFSNSRFGFNYENGDLAHAVGLLGAVGNVTIVSLHSHYSSREKSPEFFQRRAEQSITIHRELELSSLRAINLGGGFMGTMPKALSDQFGGANYCFDEYAREVGLLFHKTYGNDGPTLIVEPGVSLIGETMKLVVPVLDIKNMHGRYYAVLDSSINVLNPTRSSVKPSCSSVAHRNGEIRSYWLVGNTCMETDILTEAFEGNLAIGDYVVFDNRGAYSNNFTPSFIIPPPGIISCDGEVLKMKDDTQSILCTYK